MKSYPSRAQWLKRLASRRRGGVAFAFSGGGPLGAMQVGQLRALFEHGVIPDLVVGSSVGAMNATFLAFDPTVPGTDRLETIWRSLQDTDLFPGGRFKASWARMLVRGNRVFENSGIRKLVSTRIGNALFEDAQLPLGIVATDLQTGADRTFTSGEILPTLLASIAMPGIFPPIEIEGRMYTDGGVANNVPIAPAVAMGARTVYVLDATAQSNAQHRPLNRPIDYLVHAFGLARSQRFDIEAPLYSSKVELILIPAAPVDFYVPFASMDFTARLIDLSYEHTRVFLSGELESDSERVDESVEVIAPAK